MIGHILALGAAGQDIYNSVKPKAKPAVEVPAEIHGEKQEEVK